MTTSQGSSKSGSQASGPSGSQSSLPALFTIVVRDHTSQDLKLNYHFFYFRVLSSTIIRLIMLLCDVKQVFYTAEKFLPSTRRTIIITDQIFINFINNKDTNEIASQLYPLRKPPPPSNVYLNPFLSVSFASKVAQPAPRPTGPRGLHSRAPTPSGSTQTNAYATHRSCPPTRSVPEPPSPELPTAHSLSFHEPIYYLKFCLAGPKQNFSEDVLNMLLDPGKDTLLLVCAKKVQ